VKARGNENLKNLFAHIFVKDGSIYVKPRQKWSTALSAHIVEYISPAEMLRVFVIIYNPGRSRVAAATSP